jgi:hypothetical protein
MQILRVLGAFFKINFLRLCCWPEWSRSICFGR